MILRKIICYIFGHRSVLNYIDGYYVHHDNKFYIDIIQHECERCGFQK